MCFYFYFFFFLLLCHFCLHRFNNDKDEFLQRVGVVVQESQQRLYDITGQTCPLVFTEPKPAHADVIKEILINRKANGNNTSFTDDQHTFTHTRDLGLGDEDESTDNILNDNHDYSADQISLDK